MTDFNKLTQDKKREFLIKHVLEDKYFSKAHDTFKTYLQKQESKKLSSEELKKYIATRNNIKQAKYIAIYLKDYERAIEKCISHQSRYKDIVDDVYQEKNSIEECCASKHINGFIKGDNIFETIIEYYEDTKHTIYSYGGEDDQTLKKAIKILLSNPFLNDEIKTSQEFISYTEEFKSYIDDDKIEYNIDESDISDSNDSNDSSDSSDSDSNHSDSNHSDSS